jgi:chromate transporter
MQPPLGSFLLYFLRLGALGFGGPIALAGAKQRDLVEDREWITREDYLEGLALAQIAPGPLAAQLAIYLGWTRFGVLGATLVAFAFTIPSFLMVLALSALYLQYGGLSWMQGAFYGIGAAVIGIITRSAWKLVRSTLRADWLLWAISSISAIVTAWTESELPWLFLLAGVVAVFARGVAPKGMAATTAVVPVWWITGLHGPPVPGTLSRIFWYFAEAGAFVFGSGLAIVPFLHGGVVNQFAWLTERQFLDAVAVAMITPRPVVITVAFIGYLVAGPAGASVAALAVFLPCYLFVILPAPYFRKYANNPTIKAFVDGVTAAAIGAIAGAAFVLGKRAIIDIPTLLLGIAAYTVLWKARRIPEPLIILAAGLIGFVLAQNR